MYLIPIQIWILICIIQQKALFLNTIQMHLTKCWQYFFGLSLELIQNNSYGSVQHFTALSASKSLLLGSSKEEGVFNAIRILLRLLAMSLLANNNMPEVYCSSAKKPQIYPMCELAMPEAAVSQKNLSRPQRSFSRALMLRIHPKAEKPGKCLLTRMLL